MKLTARLEGDLVRIMRAEGQVVEAAAVRAVTAATAWAKNEARQEVGSRLSPRAAMAIQSKTYLNDRGDVAAAVGLVSHKWYRKNAGQKIDVLDAFNRGPLIRPTARRTDSGYTRTGAGFLTIPLPAAGKGARGGKATVADVERRIGRDLELVQTRGGKLWLVAPAARINSRGVGARSRSKTGRGQATIFMFRLIRQTKLPKRLDFRALYLRAQDELGERLVLELGREN